MEYKEFVVTIEEIISQDFTVIAKSKKEALNIAKEEYYKGNFVLLPGDLEYKQMAVAELNEEK